ncbi:MAG: DUF6273 domain-containing protein [Firmicutes bacterium]|nr:DUF6273 domain-containing protein [Bacillota bacterium]
MSYDVFISFKNLDIHTGRPTRDSEIARELYDTLRAKGLEVFFSNEEVQRKARPDYGDLINEALISSSVLILVGTSIENVNARWVKEEWDSFRAMLNNGKEGYMLTVLEGIMPNELAQHSHVKFATIQSYDSSNIASAADMAYNTVKRITGYSPKPKQTKVNEPATTTALKVGDYIQFGRYPQGANGEIEPLDWKVLAIEDGKALLITEMAIDCKMYNEKLGDITWYNCSLRSWVNNQFFDTAFSRAEQQKIAIARNVNNLTSKNSKRYDSETLDRVFCLSIEEVKKYFPSDDERIARPTIYTKKQGASFDFGSGNCNWWLRLPRYSYITDIGTLNGLFGHGALAFYNPNDVAVRPALWLNLSS